MGPRTWFSGFLYLSPPQMSPNLMASPGTNVLRCPNLYLQLRSLLPRQCHLSVPTGHPTGIASSTWSTLNACLFLLTLATPSASSSQWRASRPSGCPGQSLRAGLASSSPLSAHLQARNPRRHPHRVRAHSLSAPTLAGATIVSQQWVRSPGKRPLPSPAFCPPQRCQWPSFTRACCFPAHHLRRAHKPARSKS